MKTLQKGDIVPDFTAADQDGRQINLSDYKGKKLVVFFYPKANTPGCTAEACNLRDHYAELQDAGYELLGVSADSQAAGCTVTVRPELGVVNVRTGPRIGFFPAGKTRGGAHVYNYIFGFRGTFL